MALEVNCSVPSCGLPMTMPGAVLISPPLPNGTKEVYVEKFHICALCWSTKFKYMFGDEFQNDAAQWPHLQTAYAQDVEFFRVAEPPAKTYVKDPTVVEMDPEIDVLKILGRALWNKVEADMTEYFAGLEDNRLVPNYCVADVELMDVMLEHDRFWSDRKKKHPIWDLLKRGWL